jgi:leucyl aminopeptidase
MPITDEHRNDMKTLFADINNKGKKPHGGSAQAACFLERFIEKGVKWVHLDIAGPAMGGQAKGPICADGTGFGTQTLLDYLWKQTK